MTKTFLLGIVALSLSACGSMPQVNVKKAHFDSMEVSVGNAPRGTISVTPLDAASPTEESAAPTTSPKSLMKPVNDYLDFSRLLSPGRQDGDVTVAAVMQGDEAKASCHSRWRTGWRKLVGSKTTSCVVSAAEPPQTDKGANPSQGEGQ